MGISTKGGLYTYIHTNYTYLVYTYLGSRLFNFFLILDWIIVSDWSTTPGYPACGEGARRSLVRKCVTPDENGDDVVMLDKFCRGRGGPYLEKPYDKRCLGMAK